MTDSPDGPQPVNQPPTQPRNEPAGPAADPAEAGSDEVPEAARAALARVRLGARAAARVVTAPVRTRPRTAAPGQYSGPAPDGRDPQKVAAVWDGAIAEQGWSAASRAARLHGLWPQIVGEANAEHANIESFDTESGILEVRASSTTWGESLRLMLPMIRARIDEVIGAGVVSDIRVSGPVAPRWTHGRLRVQGRGPRDTYG